MGVRIDNARDQTFGRTCASAPGSALCGERLSKEFIGPPMEQVGSLSAMPHHLDGRDGPARRSRHLSSVWQVLARALRTDDDAAGLSCSSPELRHFPYCDPSLPLDDRVADLVKRMSLSEKISSMRMTNDDSPMNTSGVPRLGVPPLFISECLHGVGEGGNDMCSGGACPTAFPSPAALGCSFNRSQWFEIGTAVGREARALRNEGKAAGLVCWAPVVNLVRVRAPMAQTAAILPRAQSC